MQHGVLSVCRSSGFGLQIHPCDSSSPTLADELCELVRRSRLAGLVLAPPMSEQPDLIRTPQPRRRCRSCGSSPRARTPQDGYPCVYVDDRDAAYAITEHLIQLGHQRIGFLWGGREHRSSPERYQGYEDALKDYGIALDRKLILPGDYTFDDGFRGARKLLALKDRPTAIFGSNDEIAAGVLAAAHSDGINVPYELSIAGFEDSPFSKQSWPALTTARQATEEIARHAAQRLIGDLQREANGEPTSARQRRLQPGTGGARLNRAAAHGTAATLNGDATADSSELRTAHLVRAAHPPTPAIQLCCTRQSSSISTRSARQPSAMRPWLAPRPRNSAG